VGKFRRERYENITLDKRRERLLKETSGRASEKKEAPSRCQQAGLVNAFSSGVKQSAVVPEARGDQGDALYKGSDACG